jgi:formamidopyrimidine-DNA glycosylase
MIEMPEARTIAGQMNDVLTGKTIAGFVRGPSTHKFLWLNRPDKEFASILPGKTVAGARSHGHSIYLDLGDAMIWWSDTGGKILYHAPGDAIPKKCHLIWTFTDESALTFSMRMWGGVHLLDRDAFDVIPNDETGLPPLHPDFTFERFDAMLDAYPEKKGKGIKGFLVATGHAVPDSINGLGNAIVQDILFAAGLSPKRKIPDLGQEERRRLYDSIGETVVKAIELGGRNDEFDLFGKRGGYVRLLDSKSAGTQCGDCGAEIAKISYLGGACYVCPECQT